MRRRRSRYGATSDNLFAGAHTTINEKELNVVHSTVEACFTMNDLVTWLFPEDVIRKLKDAYPLTGTVYRAAFTLDHFPLLGGTGMQLRLDLDTVKMQRPTNDPVITFSHGSSGTAHAIIMGTLQALNEVHERFNKVRKIIDWFGKRSVSPATAAYYWPTFQSLLPAAHPFHQQTGEHYRPVTGIGEITDLLRETAGIVASAHMCPAAPARTERAKFTVTCISPWPRAFVLL
jgi:hypothetical protein